jgi:hypothetical protein
VGCGGHVCCAERVGEVHVLEFGEEFWEGGTGLVEGGFWFGSGVKGVEGVDEERVGRFGGDLDGWT